MPLIAAMLGHALVSRRKNPKNYTEAKLVLKAAVNRDNQDPFAWYQLGIIYGCRGGCDSDSTESRTARLRDVRVDGKPQPPRGAVLCRAGGVGMLAVAEIDARLYGSPFKTGYDLTDAFSASYVAGNIQRYLGWLASAETALACAGLIALALPWRLWRTDSARRARSLCAACAGVVWLTYLLYVPWDAWWYLRFLLPTWPMMAAGTVAVVGAASRLFRQPRLRRAFAAVIVFAIGVSGCGRRAAGDVQRGAGRNQICRGRPRGRGDRGRRRGNHLGPT